MNKNIILSIIIPSYKETEKELLPLLTSINNQVNLNLNNIEVIIVRDGTTELNLSLFNLLDIQLTQLVTKENKGPGVARQEGLNIARGQYIMFCDADDIIQNSGIISAMLNEIKKNDLDILRTSWLEECWSENLQQFTYVTHSNENTWMHGKIFKHDFLISNNITFHPNLRVHEDTYFLGVSVEYTKKVGFFNNISYIWKWDKNSITRRNNGEYRYNENETFIKACIYICDKILTRPEKFQDHLPYRIVQLMIYQFFILHSKVWSNHQDKIDSAEKTLVELITPYWDYWLNSDLNFIIKTYNEERSKHFNNEMEFETLEQWITHLNLPFRRE